MFRDAGMGMVLRNPGERVDCVGAYTDKYGMMGQD